jgi:hypothetical protein
MDKRAELLGCALTGKDGDSTAVAHPQCWRDAFLELKPYALGGEEVEQPLAVLSDIASDALRQSWKLFAFGLRHIEDIGRAEPNQYSLILSADVFLGLFILLALYANDRSKDADAALSLLDLPTKLVPRIQPRYSLSVRPLSGDLQNVPKALCHPQDYVECEIGESFGVSLL